MDVNLTITIEIAIEFAIRYSYTHISVIRNHYSYTDAYDVISILRNLVWLAIYIYILTALNSLYMLNNDMEGKREGSSKIKKAIDLLSAALTEQGTEEENCYVRKPARLSDSRSSETYCSQSSTSHLLRESS